MQGIFTYISSSRPEHIICKERRKGGVRRRKENGEWERRKGERRGENVGDYF